MINGQQIIGINYDNFKDAQETGAGGALRVNLGRPNVGTLWLIDRIWFRSGGANAIVLRVYATPQPTRIAPNDVIDFSPSVDENLSDETQPPIVRNSESLILDFTGGTPSDLIHFRVDYRIGYLQAFTAPNQVIYPVMPGVNISPEVARAQRDAQRAVGSILWPGSPA